MGDKVGLATPSYPAYKNILAALGLYAVDIPVGSCSHFQPTPELLETYASDLDGLIVASPSNPTGSMIDADCMKALVSWCSLNDVRLISDEIYHGITYGATAETALTFSQDAVVVNNFFKIFFNDGLAVGLDGDARKYAPFRRMLGSKSVYFSAVPLANCRASCVRLL